MTFLFWVDSLGIRDVAKRREHGAPGMRESAPATWDMIPGTFRLGLPAELRRSPARADIIQSMTDRSGGSAAASDLGETLS